MWHYFVTDNSKEQAEPTEYPSGATNAGISLFSREAMGLWSFYYKADWAEEGKVWRRTRGRDLAAFPGRLARGTWVLIMAPDLLLHEWALARYFPSTSVSSSVGWRLHSSPMGCNEDRMKSREKFITLMATHKKELRVSFSFPGLHLGGRGERNIEKEHAHFSLLLGIKLSFLCQVQGETNIFPSAGLGFWLLHDKSHSGDPYLELILADFPLKLTCYVEARGLDSRCPGSIFMENKDQLHGIFRGKPGVCLVALSQVQSTARGSG